MNFLLLEDRGSSIVPITIFIENEGHTVLNAFSPTEAQKHWNRRNIVPVHCIILDLNVPLDGLTKKQRADAKGGILAGWVWLRENVLKDDPNMRARTVIYSGYSNVLHDHIPEDEYFGIHILQKRNSTSIYRLKKIISIVKGHWDDNNSGYQKCNI